MAEPPWRLNELNMLKVVVIGETCTDKWVFGEVNRQSPEADVPILDYRTDGINHGMAGNVIANLKSLYPDINIIEI